MTTPVWLTILVAILTSVASLAGQWLAGVRQVKLATVERDARRDERVEQRGDHDRKRREESYAGLLIAARAVRDLATGPSRTTEEVTVAMTALRDAATLVELRAPVVADGVLGGLMESADRLAAVRLSGAAIHILNDAAGDFDQAVITIRRTMRQDVGPAD